MSEIKCSCCKKLIYNYSVYRSLCLGNYIGIGFMPDITQKIRSNWMALSQLEGSKKQKAHDGNHGLFNQLNR